MPFETTHLHKIALLFVGLLILVATFMIGRGWHRPASRPDGDQQNSEINSLDSTQKDGVPEASDTAPALENARGAIRPMSLAPDVSYSGREAGPKIIGWRFVENFTKELALFETVFWDERDTTTLRKLLREEPLVHGKTVLEIGTGSGLLSLCCLKAGAQRVVATDVNPAAVANAAYNADRLRVADRLETRLVSLARPNAYSVIGDAERFDFIISNPPWEDQKPVSIDQYALYDERFQLLQSLLEGMDRHLNPEGRSLLAYGCVTAVRRVLSSAPEFGLSARLLDSRDLNSLPEVFLPAMVIEITRGPASETAVEHDGTPVHPEDSPAGRTDGPDNHSPTSQSR